MTGNKMDSNPGGMWRYHARLPITNLNNIVSMGEGGTPLVRSVAIGPLLGLNNLFFKVEGTNPTGSYKDRIASVGVSYMREHGIAGWAATSSGNAGAALAAYGARAGLRGTLIVLETAPRAKLTQILACGPRVVAIKGLGHDPEIEKGTFAAVREFCARHGFMMQVTAHAFNPISMQGAKTIAYELCEALPNAPGVVYVPTGGGGLLSAIHKGFGEWCVAEPATGPGTRMVSVQAEGCDPINAAWREQRELRPIANCTSAISGIQLTAPPDGDLALAAVRESNGWAASVSDEDVYTAQRMLIQREGLFVEPASAAGVAAVMRDARANRLHSDDTIVCVLTGVGFKDANAAQALSAGAEIPVIELAALASLDPA